MRPCGVGTGLVTVVALLGVQGRLRLPPRPDLSIVASVCRVQVAGGILIMSLA